MFTIIFSINVDRKHAAEVESLKQQIANLDNIRLQLFANESKQNTDMMYDTWLLISEQNTNYRIALIDKLNIEKHDRTVLLQQINTIDVILQKQLSLIKMKSQTSQQYYQMLINNSVKQLPTITNKD